MIFLIMALIGVDQYHHQPMKMLTYLKPDLPLTQKECNLYQDFICHKVYQSIMSSTYLYVLLNTLMSCWLFSFPCRNTEYWWYKILIIVKTSTTSVIVQGQPLLFMVYASICKHLINLFFLFKPLLLLQNTILQNITYNARLIKLLYLQNNA